MPVMVLYSAKDIPVAVIADISKGVATLSTELLDASIEVRALQPVYAYNANEIHLEMGFRDFGEWSDERLADYHMQVMAKLGEVLSAHKLHCSYSFYIVPSAPPRAIWAQDKT